MASGAAFDAVGAIGVAMIALLFDQRAVKSRTAIFGQTPNSSCLLDHTELEEANSFINRVVAKLKSPGCKDCSCSGENIYTHHINPSD